MKLAAMEWTRELGGGTWRDARYALRGMRRRPGFAALAIVTLALGIGVNATSLAVSYGILIRPLPYADPSRVVIINLLSADGADLGFSADANRRLRSTRPGSSRSASERPVSCILNGCFTPSG